MSDEANMHLSISIWSIDKISTVSETRALQYLSLGPSTQVRISGSANTPTCSATLSPMDLVKAQPVTARIAVSTAAVRVKITVISL